MRDKKCYFIFIYLFVSSKCGYCAFNSFVDREGEIEAYVRALREDIHHSLRGNTQSITSIFLVVGHQIF